MLQLTHVLGYFITLQPLKLSSIQSAHAPSAVSLSKFLRGPITELHVVCAHRPYLSRIVRLGCRPYNMVLYPMPNINTINTDISR
jgi:hypothetical protein